MATYLRPVVGIAISILERLHIGRGFRRWIRTYGNTVDVIMTISKNVKTYNSTPSIQIRKRQNSLLIQSFRKYHKSCRCITYAYIRSITPTINIVWKFWFQIHLMGTLSKKKNKNTASPQIKFFCSLFANKTLTVSEWDLTLACRKHSACPIQNFYHSE